VTDPAGYEHGRGLHLDTSRKVDPGLFRIDFTNYMTRRVDLRSHFIDISEFACPALCRASTS